MRYYGFCFSFVAERQFGQALVFFQPKRIAIRDGYIGCHSTIDVYQKSRGIVLERIDIDDEFQAGDLCWIETPLNPTGESK